MDYRNCPIKEKTVGVHNAVMSPSDIEETENSVDSDQTAPKEQSDLSLHCLLRPIYPNI